MMKQSIGDYTILKELGQGSLGSVYLAEQRFLKQRVALKVLPEELSADEGFVQRFEKGVDALAQLDHPHIVKIHNVSFADGHYFLVTDCVTDSRGEAKNLNQYLSERELPLTEEEVVKIAYQIASALDYAHQKGIRAHHGIKLNNILVYEKKEGLFVALSDFGLTPIIGSGKMINRTYKVVTDLLGLNGSVAHSLANEDKYSSLHLSFLQNFAFLAPEQKKALKKEPLESKVDVYAFGVLLYYLIMGEFPEGFFELPSERVSHFKLNWDALISSCLKTDPEKRPSSLKKMLEELSVASFPLIRESLSSEKSLKPILRPQEIIRPEYEPDPGAIFQTDTTIARYHPKEVEAKSSAPLLSEMAIIPQGSFMRGSNRGSRDEMPCHAVLISSFALDIYPVTNEQFVRFLEVMGGEKDAQNSDIIRLRESRIKRSGGKLSIESGYAKHPVVGVTWYGAVAYAKWVGKRLPTEAEWEIAASGGREESLYPTGASIERSQANYFSSDTTPVMSYPPTAHGLYDMAGNVYEWCQDWYGYNYYEHSIQEPENPKGPHQGVYRVLRGGCWKSLKEDLRCSHRHRNNPGTMNGTYGFRCAADVSY